MIEYLGEVELGGIVNTDLSNNFSGVSVVGSYLLIGADEGHSLHVFLRDADKYKLHSTIPLTAHDNTEIDIEGISFADGYVFVIGSHSKARKKLDKKNYVDNRDRLKKVKAESSRDHLCRFKLDDKGRLQPGSLVVVSALRNTLEDDEILARFTAIPSKENGIDIEGIAALGADSLAIGFRGPVLRGNWTPIIKTKFSSTKDYALLFVQLGGLGIRDMAVVNDGFLLLAGPVGDGPGQYTIFHWNGIDCVPGKDGPGGRCHSLGELPMSEVHIKSGGKAEGISLIHEGPTHFQVLIVYDSIEHGGATLYKVPKKYIAFD